VQLIGIDFGLRRIGVALSDPDGRVVTPRPTLTRRRGKRPPIEPFVSLAEEVGAAGVVIGLPLSGEGEETDWCAEVRRFGEALAERLAVPVHYQDERFSSAQAERLLRRADMGKKRRADKGLVDATAATIILQTWLDGNNSAGKNADIGEDVAG
jgi:putative Holliday junction resolvase